MCFRKFKNGARKIFNLILYLKRNVSTWDPVCRDRRVGLEGSDFDVYGSNKVWALQCHFIGVEKKHMLFCKKNSSLKLLSTNHKWNRYKCFSIDPESRHWGEGHLHVDSTWSRLTLDVLLMSKDASF